MEVMGVDTGVNHLYKITALLYIKVLMKVLMKINN